MYTKKSSKSHHQSKSEKLKKSPNKKKRDSNNSRPIFDEESTSNIQYESASSSESDFESPRKKGSSKTKLEQPRNSQVVLNKVTSDSDFSDNAVESDLGTEGTSLLDAKNTFQYESASSNDSSESDSEEIKNDSILVNKNDNFQCKGAYRTNPLLSTGNDFKDNKNNHPGTVDKVHNQKSLNNFFSNATSVEDKSEDKDEDDSTRMCIRDELSHMTFEELQKLKEKLGSKVYNEAVFGKRDKKWTPKLKRENKNRPREISSKIPVSRFKEVVPVKRKRRRDPRFDDLCGTYNEKEWKRSFNFLTDIRAKEKVELKTHLKEEKDPERVQQIKYLVQRMDNQERQEKQKLELELKKKQEKQAQIAMYQEGKKPYYPKKSEQHLLNLAERYEQLKASGTLQKHLMKQRKRNSQKDRKKVFL